MIKQLILQLFNEEIIECKPIETGITNQDYLITLPSKKIVLRIPYAENHNFMDYEIEAVCLDYIQDKGFDAPLLYFDAKTGIKINEYIDNLITFGEDPSKQHIAMFGEMLRRFHQLNHCIGHEMKIREQYSTFKAYVNQPLFDCSVYEYLLDQLDRYQIISTLCHNDLVAGNICFHDNHPLLIDYEYARDNDPFFDLLSFLSENDIQDPDLRTIFYTAYFKRDRTQEECEKCDFYEHLLNLYWCQWAMMNYEQKHEDIYKEIAALKYQRLQEKSTVL